MIAVISILQASKIRGEREFAMNTNTINSKKAIPGINDVATKCPKVAAMWSAKNAFTPSEVAASSNKKALFVCPDCGQEFEAPIRNVVRSVMNGNTGCPACASRKVVPGINDLATKYPKVAAMWSSKNAYASSEVTVSSSKKAVFVCPDCGQEFEAPIYRVVNSVNRGYTGCPSCASRKVVPGINDLATKYPKVAAMWSNKNAYAPSKVSAGSDKKALFICPDCGQKFKAPIYNVVESVSYGNTGCPVCAGRKVVPGVNDLASQYPEAAAMWSDKNDYTPSEISARSSRRAIFVCPDCHKQFVTSVFAMTRAVASGMNFCPDCGKHVISAVRKDEHGLPKPIGTTLTMKDGSKATCTAYHGVNNITVEFEDGFVLYHARWNQFVRGALHHGQKIVEK